MKWPPGSTDPGDDTTNEQEKDRGGRHRGVLAIGIIDAAMKRLVTLAALLLAGVLAAGVGPARALPCPNGKSKCGGEVLDGGYVPHATQCPQPRTAWAWAWAWAHVTVVRISCARGQQIARHYMEGVYRFGVDGPHCPRGWRVYVTRPRVRNGSIPGGGGWVNCSYRSRWVTFEQLQPE